MFSERPDAAPSLEALQAESLRRLGSGEVPEGAFRPVSHEARLAHAILNAPPEPLSANPASVAAWFGIQSIVAQQSGGMTAKQLARRVGNEGASRYLGQVLERLADRGELRRLTKGSLRYVTKPPTKVLPQILRQFPERLPARPRDAFELTVLAYQEQPTEVHWTEMAQALAALVAAIPGWPPELPNAIAEVPAEWLVAAAGVEPPAYVVHDEDPPRR